MSFEGHPASRRIPSSSRYRVPSADSIPSTVHADAKTSEWPRLNLCSWRSLRMSGYGYKRKFQPPPRHVRSTPNKRHSGQGWKSLRMTQSRHFRRISSLANQRSMGDPMGSLCRDFQAATLFRSRMLPAWAGNCRTGCANSWRGCFQAKLSCKPKGALCLLSEIGARGRFWLQRR